MKSIPTRELCSLLFLFYGNIHITLTFIFNIPTYYLFVISSGFTVMDTIWLLFGEESKTPIYELVPHHVSTAILLMSGIDVDTKIKVMIIEFSTMFLMLRRYTTGVVKQVMHTLFLSTWVTTRVFWLYYLLIRLKVTGKFEIYDVNPLEYLSYMTVYLLSLKWTLESMGLTNYQSYTSILLGLPIYLLPNTLTNQQFISIFNLIISSCIHHLIKNRISLSVDSFAISFTCLTYLGYSPFVCGSISCIALGEVLTRKKRVSIITQIVYLYTLLYFSYVYDTVKLIAFLIFNGYYKMRRYSDTTIWHLANGLYLTAVTLQSLL